MSTANNDSVASDEPQQLKALVASIKEIGQLQPAIRDEHGTIRDGHMRIRAAMLAGKEPWIETRPGLTETARYHSLIRRTPGPLELAEIAQFIRSEGSAPGARRAPGMGKAQDAVAAAMRERFALSMSPRNVAYAFEIANAEPEARAVVAAAAPESMREAQRLLRAHCLGTGEQDGHNRQGDRTELAKTAFEFKAAVQRRTGPLEPADRALLEALRASIDLLLSHGEEASDAGTT